MCREPYPSSRICAVSVRQIEWTVQRLLKLQNPGSLNLQQVRAAMNRFSS
jgi:hypothetical protein